MKHFFIGIWAVLSLAGILWFGWSQYHDFLTQGMQAPEGIQKVSRMEQDGVPDFRLRNLRQEEVSLSQFRGKIVILNMWASWCEPCVTEFPSMMRLIEKFKGEIVLLAVSADNQREDLESFVKLMKADQPNVEILWDEKKEVGGMLGTVAMPESYIIGRDGKLIRKVAGVEEWDGPMAQQFFKELVELSH